MSNRILIRWKGIILLILFAIAIAASDKNAYAFSKSIGMDTIAEFKEGPKTIDISEITNKMQINKSLNKSIISSDSHVLEALPEAGSNLIINGNFELDPSQSGAWGVGYNETKAVPEFMWDGTVYYGASGHSLSIKGNSVDAFVCNNVSVLANQLYTLDIMGKAAVTTTAEELGLYVYMVQLDVNGDPIANTSRLYYADGTFHWSEARVNFLSVANAKSIFVVFGMEGSGNVWFDNASVTQLKCDINKDNKVSIEDALVIKNHILGKVSISSIAIADMDANGKITSKDYALLAKNVKETTNCLYANPGRDIYTYKNFDVKLNGAGSVVEYGRPISYSWRLISVPNGSNAVLDNSALAQPSFKADAIGSYEIGLVVSDGVNRSVEKTITVNAKELGNTVDDMDLIGFESNLKCPTSYNFGDYIALTNGWILAMDETNKKVVFFNAITGDRGSEYTLSGVPNRLELDFENNCIYVSIKDQNKIAKINIENGEVNYITTDEKIGTIELGNYGILFGLSENEKLYAIDTKTTAITEMYNARNQHGMMDLMQYNKVNDNLIIADQGSSPSSLYRYVFNKDTLSLVQEQKVFNAGTNGSDLSISNDGKHIAFCCGGGNGAGYTVYDIDSTDINNRFGEWNTDAYPESAEFTLDSKYIVISNGSFIKVFDVTSHVEVRKIGAIMSWIYYKIGLSRGGKVVYSIDQYNNVISMRTLITP